MNLSVSGNVGTFALRWLDLEHEVELADSDDVTTVQAASRAESAVHATSTEKSHVSGIIARA